MQHTSNRKRILNLFSRLVCSTGTAGPDLLTYSADTLIKEIKGMTGLRDFGDEDFQEGLSVLIDSAKNDAHLSYYGRLLLSNLVTSALVSRLRLIAVKKDHPEIFNSPVIPPLFVVGLPRSGTTFLHRLLSSLPEARPIPTWELYEPVPGPGPDIRKFRVRLMSYIPRFFAPEMDSKHELRYDRPEECIFLFNNTMVSIGYWQVAPVYSYIDWCIEQDMEAPFSWYYRYLQYIQSNIPGSRLTLKAPVYTGQLDALFKAIPDAMVIQTHRDPFKVVPSTMSLFNTIHSLLSEQPDISRMIKTNLRLLGLLMERNIRALEKIDKGKVLHIEYKSLTSDPVGTVIKIQKHFNLPWSDVHLSALKESLKVHKKDRHGTHKYTLKDFGLNEPMISCAFSDYLDWKYANIDIMNNN